MDREAYTVYRQLLTLEQVQGSHTQLISLYIGARKSIHQWYGRLKTERQESQNIKDKINRKRVLSAIENSATELKRYGQIPANGLVVFSTPSNSCSIIPVQPSTLNYYRCDSTFYLKPLLSGNNTEQYGLLAIDGNQATLATLSGGVVSVLEQVDSCVSRAVKKGGQSQRRYSFARRQSLHNYYNNVGDLCNHHWRKPQIRKIYYGGILPASQQFLKVNTTLYSDVRAKFSQCYAIQYSDRVGINALIQLAESDMVDTAYKEKRLFFERVLRALDKGYQVKNLAEAAVIIRTKQMVLQALDKQQLYDTEYVVLESGQPGHSFVKTAGGVIALSISV